jgi:hypothetical protein
MFPGALHTSHALFPPQTPFLLHENASVPGTARTPHEPFTAFVSRTDPFDAALAAAPRLDETDNPLADLFNGILSFVERDVKRIMDVAERISARIGQRTDEVDDGASAKGFEIFANVVWAELARALKDELGSTLFAAGRPDEFRRVRTFAQTPGYESHAANAEPRDDAGVYPLSPISCAVRPCYSGDGYASDVPIVRAAMAAACVLPAAMERDRDASRRRLVREQTRTGVKLEERLVTFASQRQCDGRW